MSVFHKLYLGNECDFSNLKQVVIDWALVKNAIITNTSDELVISDEGFTIFIGEGGNSVVFRSEDYGLDFKFDFYIDINPSYKNWAVELMEFVGKILKAFKGDFVLEANGDITIIMRKNDDGIVIVDDSRLGKFPFDHLGLEYMKGKFEQV